MDAERVGRFWQRRAATSSSTRWTSQAQLAHDLEVLEPYAAAESVLDLGAGTGELLTMFARRAKSVTAVDMVPEFLDRIVEFPGLERVVSRLEQFAPSREYDLIMMFGVVTCIDVATEERILDTCRRSLATGGAVVVKHQCSDADSFEVDRPPSDDDDIGYVGRYPSITEQVVRLGGYFEQVRTIHYPEDLRRHANSHDCAFVCG